MDAPSSAKKILIVEDVAVVSQMLEKILQREGFEITVVGDGAQCLEVAPTLHPDLILLDLMMPRVNGLEALKRLRANDLTRDIGVIFCSAKDFKTEIEQAHELGAFAFIHKPVDRQELILDDQVFSA